MADEGKIVLTGFNLEPAEKVIVDNLIKNYKSKISEKIGFKEINLRIKKSQHGKTFLHQVQGRMMSNVSKKQLNAEVADYNLFSAIAEVFEKLMHEAEHSMRTRRQ